MKHMKYLKWLEGVFFKNNYNFTRPDGDLFNFHPQTQLILATLGIFLTGGVSLRRLICPCISIFLTWAGIALEALLMYHSVEIEDLSLATECFCYLMMLGSIPLIYFGLLYNKHKILRLIADMNEDFHYVCSLGPIHRKQFLDKQLLIWQLFLVWMTLLCVTGVLFMLFPLIMLNYQTLFATQDEYTIRPLAFPIWLPHDDAYRTPNYESLLLLEMSFSILFCQAFGGYVYLLFHSLLHYDTMMDMIILDFQMIFDGLDESVLSLPRQHPCRIEVKRVLRKRIGRIVTWHLSVFRALSTVSSVFGPPLVYQVSCSSVLICLVAFQVAKKLDEGVVHVLFISLLIVGCVQLWIPCYLGTVLRNKGFAVGDACFNCGWNETALGLLIRTDILLIIAQSQIPIYIKFIGLPNIQLETYSSIMSSAYSYFNMLRQYSK